MDVTGIISSCEPLDVLLYSCGGRRDWILAIDRRITESEELARGKGMRGSQSRQDATW